MVLKNAGILAAKIVASSNPERLKVLENYMEEMKAKVIESADSMK